MIKKLNIVPIYYSIYNLNENGIDLWFDEFKLKNNKDIDKIKNESNLIFNKFKIKENYELNYILKNSEVYKLNWLSFKLFGKYVLNILCYIKYIYQQNFDNILNLLYDVLSDSENVKEVIINKNLFETKLFLIFPFDLIDDIEVKDLDNLSDILGSNLNKTLISDSVSWIKSNNIVPKINYMHRFKFFNNILLFIFIWILLTILFYIITINKFIFLN